MEDVAGSNPARSTKKARFVRVLVLTVKVAYEINNPVSDSRGVNMLTGVLVLFALVTGWILGVGHDAIKSGINEFFAGSST